MMKTVQTTAPTKLISPRNAWILLGLQLPMTLASLAFVPGGWPKLVAFLLCWALTFGRITKPELLTYVLVSVLFSVMDISAVRQGAFAFDSPDLLGLPMWEFFMWGFYVLHCLRLLGGNTPDASRLTVVVLAVLFAVPFVVLNDPWQLLAASASVLAIALGFFHEREDFAYLGYMIFLGALVEYCGVWSGQWHYPGEPLGGVPLWFATMWGGIGLFTRRLILPLLRVGLTRANGRA